MPAINEPVNTIGDFSRLGRYSNMAKEFYKDTQRVLKCSEGAADLMARHFVTDFSTALKEQQVNGKVGTKPDKDMMLTLSEAAKKKVTPTRPISIMAIVVYMDNGYALGINPTKTELVLNENLASYVAESEKKAEEKANEVELVNS